jgi:predicted MFS family arabinose efflux permease
MARMESRLLTGPFARVWLASLGGFASFGALLLALPLYARDELEASDLGVGFAVGAGSVGAVLASAPLGRISDRRGRRVVLLGGAAVMTLGYVALAFGPPLGTLALVRMIAGAGEAAFVVGTITMAADLAPDDRRGEAISLITIASFLGLTAGAVAADLVRGDGRFAAVWILAAALVVLPGLVVLTIGETRPHATEEAPPGWLPPRDALMPGLLVFIGLLGFGGFNAFAALYAREIGFGRPGFVFALFGAVIVVVRTLGRRLPDRLGGRRTLVFSFVLLAAGLATLGVWQSESGLLVGTAIFAAGQALAYPAAALLAMEVTSPTERSAVLGSVGAFVDVALGVGAFALGAVAETTGYAGAFLVSAAVPLSGLLVLASLRRSSRIALEEGLQ